MKNKTEKLRKLMEEYDIPHPLRGGKYLEYEQLKMQFNQKIIEKMQSETSYLNYKKDQLGTLDMIYSKTEEYQAEV